MSKLKENNLEIQKKNQNKVRKLEEFYNTNMVSDMLSDIEVKKQELVLQMLDYAERNRKPFKFNRDGIPTEYKVEVKPIVILNYFFKPITPISSQEPEYNAEKLSMVYDYYCDILAEVNDKIGDYPSSLTSFCKLAGITLNTLRTYRNSDDLNMRIITEKIYDQIGDANVTMSQMGIARERTTIFKMKSQNEMVEKEQPKVTINITQKPDFEKINARLDKYKQFAEKKGKK